VISDAIKQARPARLHILEKMLEAIDKPRTEVSPFAPRLLTMQINPDQIGMVIGPGGKQIKAITEKTTAKVDIQDDGTVTISAIDSDKAMQAKKMIEGITHVAEAGNVYMGKVTRVIPIGAFVEFMPGKEGMIHISQLADYRVNKVEDEVNLDDEVLVKVREIDSRGRVNLTRLGIHPDEAASAKAAAGIEE